MILYSNGCSFTWGGSLYKLRYEEVSDEYKMTKLITDDDIEKERLETVYPYQLKKLFNFTDVINESIGGGSNARVVRKTLGYFNKLLSSPEPMKPHFVTIQWTELCRNEICRDGAWYQFMPNGVTREDPATRYLHPHPEEFKDIYFKYMDSDDLQLSNFMQQVYCLGNFFKVNKIPYIFFQHARNIQALYAHAKSKLWIEEREFANFLNQFTWYNGDCLESFMYQSGIESCDNGSHPSRLGHIQWAQKIYKYINDKGLLNQYA